MPALPVVGEERLPELGMLCVGAAVFDLELVLRSGPGHGVVARVVTEEPEFDARVAAPVLRSGRRDVVAEAAVARIRGPGAPQHVVVRDARPVELRDRQRRGAAAVPTPGEDAGAGDRRARVR